MKFLRVAFLTLLCNFVLIHTSTFAQEAPFGFLRCGTVDNAPAHIARGPEGNDYTDEMGPIVVNTVFHVIHKSDGTGNVPDSQISDQVDVLNDAFAPNAISFELAGVNRVESNRLFQIGIGTFKERIVKRALAVDPTHTLNVYLCEPTNRSSPLLGWAVFPWQEPESSFMHGVVVLHSSLPGGSAIPYDEGDTLTHEVGHYLGLFHTFQGGCSASGDSVDDTPSERSPAYGCPEGRDSCPQIGFDPIHNFMDYSDDFCMFEFTSGQFARVDWAITTYKPGLLAPPAAPPLPASARSTNRLATTWAKVKMSEERD